MSASRPRAALLALVVGAGPGVANAQPSKALVAGIGIAVGGATGASGEAYRPGAGLDAVVGGKLGSVTLEVHLGTGLGTTPKLEALREPGTRGSFVAQSVIARYQLTTSAGLGLSVFGGGALTAVPLLAVGTVSASPGAMSVNGIGFALGAGVLVPIGENLQLAIDASIYPTQWELPAGPYATDLEEPTAMTVAYTASLDDVDAMPFRLTVALRALVF